jgi:hypothetical protein
MKTRTLVLALSVLLWAPVALSAQSAGDRVRIQLVGLRQLEDTVVRWQGDTLLVLKSSNVLRNQIVRLDRWQPRPVARSWIYYTSVSVLASTPLFLLQRKDELGLHQPRYNPFTLFAVNAGIGVVFTVVSRVANWGRWRPVAAPAR